MTETTSLATRARTPRAPEVPAASPTTGRADRRGQAPAPGKHNMADAHVVTPNERACGASPYPPNDRPRSRSRCSRRVETVRSAQRTRRLGRVVESVTARSTRRGAVMYVKGSRASQSPVRRYLPTLPRPPAPCQVELGSEQLPMESTRTQNCRHAISRILSSVRYQRSAPAGAAAWLGCRVPLDEGESL